MKVYLVEGRDILSYTVESYHYHTTKEGAEKEMRSIKGSTQTYMVRVREIDVLED